MEEAMPSEPSLNMDIKELDIATHIPSSEMHFTKLFGSSDGPEHQTFTPGARMAGHLASATSLPCFTSYTSFLLLGLTPQIKLYCESYSLRLCLGGNLNQYGIKRNLRKQSLRVGLPDLCGQMELKAPFLVANVVAAPSM